jgi:coproporphyrinogen III oxidase-like Fe-S oxidoreductase
MNTPTSTQDKADIYDSRSTWPPHTYRDYPSIQSQTYQSYMEFLSKENTSKKLMELQPWVSFCDSRCAFCYFPTTATNKANVDQYIQALKKELEMYAKTTYVKTSVFDEIVLGGEHQVFFQLNK